MKAQDHCERCGSARVITEGFTHEHLVDEVGSFGASILCPMVRRTCLDCWHREETFKTWDDARKKREAVAS